MEYVTVFRKNTWYISNARKARVKVFEVIRRTEKQVKCKEVGAGNARIYENTFKASDCQLDYFDDLQEATQHADERQKRFLIKDFENKENAASGAQKATKAAIEDYLNENQ